MPNWNQRKDRVPTDVITDRPTFEVEVDPTRVAPILAFQQTCSILERPHLTVRRGDPIDVVTQPTPGVKQVVLRAYCHAVNDLILTTTKILVANIHLSPIAAQAFIEMVGYQTESTFYARYNPHRKGINATLVHWA